MRSVRSIVVLAFAALVLPLVAAAAGSFPTHVDLLNGQQPEGIAIGPNDTFYVGSIPTGAVVRGDLRTGAVSTLVPAQSGRAAVGVAVDNRDRLFVAGGPTGRGFVYDARTGGNIADFTFTPPGATFVNDVVVTRTAAWFTDSVNPVLYKVPIAGDGTLGAAITVPFSGDIMYQPGFNVNGIEATPNGRTLVIVQSNTGKLFTVDQDGVTDEIEGATVGGDGLLLDGRTLYAVTRAPVDQIVVIRLAPDLSSGQVVGNITSPD